MTSSLRITKNSSYDTFYVRVSGPYYIDSGIGATLVPFTYENGVLDIANIDNVASFAGTPLMDSDIGLYNLPLYKFMGGSGLITSLGANFLRYIRNWRSTLTIAPVRTSDIAIFTNGIMTKIQRSPKTVLNSGSVVRINTEPPSSDFYVEGPEYVNYRTTWIFKKPLTITTIEDGVKKYITFNSTLY